VPEPGVSAPVKRLAWSVDQLYLSYRGGDEFFPIPLNMRTAGESDTPFLQIGETRVPVLVLSEKDDELVVRVKNGQQGHLVDELDGRSVSFVKDDSEVKMAVTEARPFGIDGYQIFYRPLVSYLSKESSSRLHYVADVARSRGLHAVAIRVGELLDFSDVEEAEEDDDEDTEALGPGFPGTDPRIVTYVKAPQTQQVVEEPKFTRNMPLHERI